MAGGQIQWGMSFKIDKAGLNDLKTELLSIQKLTTADYSKGKHSQVSQLAQELKQIKQSAAEVQTALDKSFNTNLGTLNVVKFNQELKKLDINKIAADLSRAGTSGQSAFRNLVTQTLTTNLQLKETHKLLDSIATSMKNTIQWGVTSSVFNTMTSSIERAWNFSKSLDTSLNSIRIVTGKSADEMERFAKQANKASQNLGRSTKDYTDASLIYYQQGLGDAEVAARTETTLKAANVTGQTGAEVSEQLTAVWNGYKVAAEETELYIDKLAAVAANSASDLEELSTGISKVASAAKTAGVDIDELTAQVATIVSVTREAPETVGSSLKTIYARLGDLKVDGVDEFGVSLGKVSQQLEDVGVKVLDESGDMRDMGDIITDLAAKWDTWTAGQKQAVAVAAAGKMQYTRLMTLMENWDMYRENLETSQNAMGTLQEQQDIYMESTEAHLQQLSTAWERVWIAMSDSKSTRSLIDVLTGLVTGMANFTEAVGGGGNALLLFGSVGTQVFSKQIAQGIATMINNFRAAKDNAVQLNAQLEIMQQFKGININDTATQRLIEMKEQILSLGSLVTSEQHNIANAMIQSTNNLNNQEQEWKENLAAAEAYIKRIGDFNNVSLANTKKDSTGNVIKEYADEKAYNQGHQQERQALENYQKELQKTTNEINNYKKALASVSKVQAEAIKNNTTETREKETQALKELASVAENVKTEMAELASDSKTAEPQVRALLNAIKEFDKGYTNNPDAGLGDIPEALERLLTTYTNITNQMKTEANNTANVISQEGNGASQRIQEAIRAAEQEYDKFINSIKTVQMVQQVTNLISALGQLTSGIKTLANIPSILNDEDLSTGEKALQIIMALGTAIPMIVTGVTSAGAALNALSVANGGVALSSALATGGIAGLASAVWTLLAPILPVVAAIALLTAGIYALVKAYNADADAAKEAAKASKEASKAADEARESYEKLVNAFEGYDTAVEKMKDLTEGTDEYTEALKDANTEAMNLIKANGDLAKKATRNAQGLIEFRDKDGKLIDREQLEKQSLASVNKASAAANLAQIDSNNASLKSQRTNFIREFIDNYNNTKANPRIASSQLTESSPQILALENKLDDILKIINETGAITEDDIKAKLGNSILYQDLIDSLMETDNKKELENLANELNKNTNVNKLLLDESLRNSLENDETYAGMSEAEKNAVADIYREGLTQEERDNKKKELEDKWYQDAAFGGGNEDDVHARYAEIRGWTLTKNRSGDTADFVDAEGNEHTKISDDTMRAYIVQYELAEKLAQYNPENLKNIEATIQGISDVGNAISEETGSEMLGFASRKDTNFDENKITLAMREKILKSIESGDMLSDLSGITDEQWKSIGYDNAQAYIDAIKNGLDENNFDVKTARKTSLKRLGGATDDASKVSEGIQTGDLTKENITKDESYQNLIKQLNELKSMYPEVTAAAEVLNKEWLIGTQEYTEALAQVQDTLYQAKVESLTIDVNDKIDELSKYLNETDFEGKLILDDTEFKNKMDAILEAEYQIDVSIHAEAEQEFNDISNALSDISEQAALIGENFVVSANDIRELNNTFPGIIQNMRDLGDGTVQLNQEVVQSAIGMAQAEIAADSQATIAKLKNQANLLRQKQVVYQNMAEAAMVLAQSETQSDETAASQRAIIDENLTKLKGLNDQIQTQTKTDNDKIVADSANTNGEIAAKNWASAYQSAAQSSYQFAQVAVANMKAAVGEGNPQAPGDFSVNYSGSSGQSSEAKVLEGTQGALDKGEGTSKEDWAKLAQQYQMLADNAGAAANDIDGMIAQIGASNVENLKKFNNIKSGKGANPDKGGSKNEPDIMDKLEDEKDRYHDIDIILKQIETDLNRLEKQKDKLFGKDLIENLNKQLQTLDKQIDATNEKIRIAQGEAGELRNKLSGYGTAFNADGTIANYTQVYQSQLNYVNSLIAQYNSMSKEQQEAFKDTVETAKENFDKFTEAINNYDTLISDTIPGLQDEIQDAIDKEIEIKIEEFTMEIEIRLDLSEAERDWNEFRRKVIDGIKDDDILGNTKARLRDFSSYYKADNTGEVQALTQQVLNTKAQLEQMDKIGTSDWYGDNRAKALEDLKSYTDQLMESLGNVEDLVQEIKDSYLDMMDEAAEKFGDQINLYEQVRDIITHDMNVIELVYGEESYKDLEKYYEKQEENYNKQLDFNRQQKEFWYNQMIAIEKAGGKNSEAWLKAKENWMSAVSEWNSAIEEAIENLQNKYQNAINLIFQGLNDKVTGGLGLEYVSEEWELINQNADQYLDTINSLYGIQDLENKYLDAIDNTDSISAQQKLNELMEEEVAALKEKDKLTQYDIDRANMKYEIALKQIALEEAQQNKSTMRLRRDSQGNYTYQYVADNDQVGQIEDELSALKNELYNFDLEHYRDNLDQVLSIYTEFQEKMAEAALINDPEERQERELLLREQYGELINGLVEQNEDIRTNLHESAFTELADLYGIEYANFQQLSEDEKTVMMEQMIPQWDSAIQHMTDTFAGNDEGEGGFLPTCRDAFKQLDDITKQYQTDLGELQQSAGTDFDNIRNGIDENISKTQELITNNDELIRSYQDQLSAIGAVISELQQLVSQYNAARDAAIAATEAAYGYWKAQQQQAANAAGKNVSSGVGNSNSVNSNSNLNNNNNSGGSGSGSGESGGGASVGNKITYSGKYYYDSFGTSPAGSKYSGVADGVTIDIVNNNPYGIHVKSSDGKYPDLGWIKKSQVTRWNTGGYTGDWGDDSGRLAILDRKELVLNKEDTPNILNAVEIMRGIANSMNLSMLSRMAGSINGVQNSSNSIAADSDTLEQNVHIDATFPGVKDAREIEQALNNLVNVASQRIGHNRR